MLRLILPTCLAILTFNAANAKSIWSDNSISFLAGNHYEVGPKRKQIITLEHASGHQWGDLFYFVDRLKGSDGSNETYMELSPRISFGKLKLIQLENSFIKDILLASTIEMGQSANGSFNHYLVGIGFDIDMPGFKFFQWNFYRRNNDNRDDSWQLTQTWSLPFTLGAQSWRYDGFIDWSSSTNQASASLNFTSQLKWDLGQFTWQTSNELFLGIEYVLWRNKFGIRNTPQFDTHEDNVNLLIKYHF
ncbi:MAG: DUF5020 family protein [Gammaproteobacteria bacterium]|nr:DUF5020 family protein [Gammaproteobacteria bacterium]